MTNRGQDVAILATELLTDDQADPHGAQWDARHRLWRLGAGLIRRSLAELPTGTPDINLPPRPANGSPGCVLGAAS